MISNRQQRGESLTSVLVTIGISSILVFGVMQYVSTQVKSAQSAVALGEKEDLREYVRQRVSCEETIKRDTSDCTTAVTLYDSTGAPVSSADGTIAQGNYRVDATCAATEAGKAVIINYRNKLTANASPKPLFDIPMECQVPIRCPVNELVGVWGRNCGANWCSRWENVTLNNGVVLPADVFDISLKIVRVNVDDWSPSIRFNGTLVFSRNDPANTPAYSVITDISIGHLLQPGSNVFFGRAWNKHTYWSAYVRIQGEYFTRTACSATFLFQDLQ